MLKEKVSKRLLSVPRLRSATIAEVKKASLQDVAKYLDVPYSTVSKWSKKKKEALRYGVVVIKEIQRG